MSGEIMAIVLAGGSGTRFAASDAPATVARPGSDRSDTNPTETGSRNKVFVEIGGRPLIEYPLVALDRCPAIDHLVLVVRPGDERAASATCDRLGLGKLRATVHGGATRADSEAAGIAVIPPTCEIVLIHDGARPFPTTALVQRLVAAVRQPGVAGAIPAMPVAEAVVDDEGAPVDTDDLVRVQTPQAFDAELLRAAYLGTTDPAGAVDTAEAVTLVDPSARVVVVEGDERNLKVTVAADRSIAERLATTWDGDRWRDVAAAWVL